MKEDTLKGLCTRTLAFTGGTIRLVLAGIGASLAVLLMIDKFRRRRHGKRVLPYEKIKEALKR